MIRSLLLATVAVPTLLQGQAYAADAVAVADPEQAEYVRVCDVYGPGFFYLPGTETCLRVSGYVRYDIGVGELLGSDVDGDGNGDTYYKRARAALQTDARSQTEFGTLRAYMQVNFDYDRGGAIWNYEDISGTGSAMYINHAYLELGGFRAGMTDSVFSTFTDYAGDVINDWLLGFGPFRTQQISYTYTGPLGFAATIALETGSGTNAVEDYVPNVVAGGSLTQGWGKVATVAAYDSRNDVWAGKARVDVDVTDTISLFGMVGYKSEADTRNYYGNWGGSWAVWGGGSAKFGEKTRFNAQLAYDDDSNLVAVANVAYTLVENFVVTPELVYADDLDDAGDGSVSGFLRLQASF
ncbi:hypothetical protein GGQ99_000856 [Aminobacter niigataensis]|uniref:Porin n=1 Tax=Aminobacter niigataensis TaxID=83265 RepID=A0ABR6KX96_9HYPH|nr:porin [Aminobacter niigataensis]MBB4649134.1 hypothetical protein [Aminobacter niigataensis]